jgi:hypothetical protein
MSKQELFNFDPIPHADNKDTDVGDGTVVLGRWTTSDDGKKASFACKQILF